MPKVRIRPKARNSWRVFEREGGRKLPLFSPEGSKELNGLAYYYYNYYYYKGGSYMLVTANLSVP